jgi:hypothetical protein
VEDFGVPGFDLVELLGFGSGGEVWLARERATGGTVALKRLRPGADLAARDRLRREAAVLAGVDHPHVVRLRAVVGAGDDLVLVLDLAAGGSLARLLTLRGPLTAGEVVTVAVPLAQALADVHARGLVHGDVTPANVLFTSDGRPLLGDLGVSRLLGAGEGDPSGTAGFVDPAVRAGAPTGPASDVHGLAATCLAALSCLPAYDAGGARVRPLLPHPLVDVLERALAPDPAARPSAAELAHAVWGCARAEPVRLAGGERVMEGAVEGAEQPVTHPVPRPAVAPAEPDPRPPRRRTVRPRWRPTLAVLLGGTAVAMAAVTGIAWAGAGSGSAPGGVRGTTAPASTPSPTPPPTHPVPPSLMSTPSTTSMTSMTSTTSTTSWVGVLRGLDAVRSGAFARADGRALHRVYTAGSPALRRDRAQLRRMTRAGLRAAGLRLQTRAVTELERSAEQVRLRVVDVLPAYRLVGADGSVVAQRRGRGEATWTVTLRRAGDGRWRIYDVARG